MSALRYLPDCLCQHEIREARRQSAETAALHKRLQPWAFIYMAARTGGAEVPMYLATRTDAEKFCGDDRTKGIGRGGPWAFLFTSAANYVLNPLGHSSLADLTRKARADDGRFEGLAAELGITLYGRDQFEAVLGPIMRPRLTAAPEPEPGDGDLFDLLDGGAA